jgi:multiple sugar transport system substrate-binding protein
VDQPSGSAGASGRSTDYAPGKSAAKVWLIPIVLLVAGLVVGTGVGWYVAQPAAKATPLIVIGPWASSEEAAFRPVLDLFSRTTGIPYEYRTARQEYLATDLPIDFAAGRSRGDLIFMTSAFIRQAGKDGHASSLTGTVSESGYAPGALDPVKNGTAIYGGAYTGKVKPGFWYRHSFFDANGFSPPTTWAEFGTLLANIDAAIPGASNAVLSGDPGWVLSDITEHFIATYGGPGMHRNLTAGTLAWTDASVRDVFANYLVPSLQSGHWSAPRNFQTGYSEFWAKSYGLYFMGSWITVEAAITDPTDLGVFSLPGAPGATGIVFGPDYFFVPKYATHLAQAKELAKFLASATAQEEQIRHGGNLATATGVPITDYPVVDAGVARLLGGKEVLPDLDDTKGNPFSGVFWSQLEGLWADPSTLTTVLQNIQAAA